MESFFCSDLLRTESHSSQLIAGVARAVLQASQCIQCTETSMYIIWYVSIHHVPHPLRSEQVSLPTPQATSSSRHSFHWSSTAAAVFHTDVGLWRSTACHTHQVALEGRQSGSTGTALQVTIYLYMQHNHCLSPL